MQHYDIIGDIHGHSNELKILLAKMGYEEKDGVYRHAARKAIFLGDVIDRGPNQIETYRIVRQMCEVGSALAIMGNHEFNAVCWQMVNEDGQPLREHTAERRKQHERLLSAVDGKPGLHDELIEWMKSLPLWLDLGGFLCVHACPSVNHMNLLRKLTTDKVLAEAAWRKVAKKGSDEYEAAETILKGVEYKLPEGLCFHDSNKHERTEARISFWVEDVHTTHNALMDTEAIRHKIPLEKLPVLELVSGKPVFFGHYWMRGEPILTGPRYACLDFSVAQGGHLVAYRWSGETELSSKNLISVSCGPGH